MTRTREQIAVDFLDDILLEYGFEKEQVYDLLNALEQVPYLTEVHPLINLETIGRWYFRGLHLSAAYTGDQQIGNARISTFVVAAKPEIQQQVEELYADLAARTGFQFQNASPDLTGLYCTAQVLVEGAIAGSGRHKELNVALYKK